MAREIRGSTLQALCFLATLLAGTLGAATVARAVDELDYGLEQHTLARIDISGNTTFSTDELKAILQLREPSWLHPFRTSRYRPDLLESQLRLLERFYRRQGFHQAVVKLDSITAEPQGHGDELNISIVEGPRTYLEAVRFLDPGPLTVAQLRQGLEYLEGTPAPADLNDFGGDLYTLRTRYWDLGYLDVQIEPVLTTRPTSDPQRFAATLEYRITSGPAITLRRIRIEGNQQTHTDLIQRELRIKEGGPFSWSAIEQSRRRLLETGLLRDVSFSPVNVDTINGQADLLVQVVERKPAYYELGAGVGSRERVRLLGAWAHNNLWGSGRRLFLRGKIYWNVERIIGSTNPHPDAQFNYRTDILYVNPHLRGSRFRLDFNVYLERETRGESGLNLQTLGFAAGTQFHGGAKVINHVALQLDESDPKPHPDAPDSLQELFRLNNIRKTQTRSIVYTFLEDKRDDILRPARGSFANALLTLAGGILQGDNSFVRVEGGWHAYTAFPLGGILAFRTRLGMVWPYGKSQDRGSNGVPYAYRFFAGGGSSVRGYRESSLGPQITNEAERDSLRLSSDVPLPNDPARGGNYLLLTSVEWRFPLPLLSRWKFGSVIFLDGGNVWAQAKDIRLRAFRMRSFPRQPSDPLATKVWDYRYSVGTGLRLDTPFGPVRVDAGFPLKRAPDDDKVVYHFSLGYPF